MGVRGPSRVGQPHLKLGNDPYRARQEPRPPAGTSLSLLVAAGGRAAHQRFLLAGRFPEVLLHRLKVVRSPAGFMAGLIIRHVGVGERDLCASFDGLKYDLDSRIGVRVAVA